MGFSKDKEVLVVSPIDYNADDSRRAICGCSEQRAITTNLRILLR